MATLDGAWRLACLIVLNTRLTPVAVAVLLAFRRSLADRLVLLGLAYHVLVVLCAPHVGLRRALFSRPPDRDWAEDVVLVTGSEGALGRALCADFARRGATVVGVDVVPASTPAGEGGHPHHSYQADISSRPAVQHLAARLAEDVGRPVSVLVNNAGVVHGRPVLDLSDAEIDRSVGVNYLAHIHLLRAFLPGMLARRSGAVVTISSALGIVGASGLTDYCSAKAAVAGLHDALSRELLHHYKCPAVKALLVQPAFISTPLFARARLPRDWLFRFAAPLLTADGVAGRVVDEVERGRGGVVRLPLFVNLVPLVLLHPLVREIAQWASGADAAMDGLAPRRPSDEGVNSEPLSATAAGGDGPPSGEGEGGP